jgi:hypothetical protein
MKKTLSVLMGVFLVALLLGCSGVVGDADIVSLGGTRANA